MQTTQPLFRSNPLLSDSQPTSASWIRWIGYGWKNARSSSSVRHSRSCLSDSQSNANTITAQCKEVTDHFRTELLVGPGFSVRAGFELKFFKMVRGRFRACIQSSFYNIQSNDFFRSWRGFVVLTAGNFVDGICDFFFNDTLELQTHLRSFVLCSD